MPTTIASRVREELEALVMCESPSRAPEAIERCAALTAELGAGWLSKPPDVVRVDGHPHLLWSFGGATKVLVLGHYDTVWPLGTTDRWPFAAEGDDGDKATGPGIFDMKAGIIQSFLALSQLDDLDGVSLLITADEEIGSPSSRTLIEDTARGAAATLVLEASLDGALKLVRKGVSLYNVDFTGKAAHAGLEPEKGINSVIALSHWTIAASALANPALGTSVTPSLVQAGTAINVVPSHATLGVDVRMTTTAEQARIDRSFRGIEVPVPGIGIELSGGPNRAPLESARSAALFSLAQEVAAEIGRAPITGVSVGGASDGNLTAGIGIDTLDGLGAVGEHAHAEGEWASLAAIEERARLVAGVTRYVLAR
jgi:glutamate carboxypeptidase